MTAVRASESTDAVSLVASGRALRTVSLVVALAFVLCLCAGTAGAAAPVDAAPTHGPGTPTDAVSGADPFDRGTTLTASGPLDDANGTTEVVVRFTPVGDPDALGDPDGDGGEAVADLRDRASDEQAAFEAFADSREGVRIEREFWLANAMLVTVDADAVTAKRLLSVENVTAIHENVAIETLDGAGTEQVDARPTGSYTSGLRLVDAPTAWDRYGTRGAGATVAVVDTGVDPSHRDVDLVGWASFDENGTLVSDDLGDASDPDGHGTHVAGTVAGGSASGTHIGVAPDADLYALDAFGEDGTATFAGVLAAMEHATVTADADVIQLSLGASGTFRGFIAPVRNARATGAIVVAAAGNEGANTSSGPANAYDAVAVGAVDDERAVAAFSSGQAINATAAFGTYPEEWPEHYVVPDVAAPGVGVVSAEAGTKGGYVRRQGTSMAAPHVSGIAALAVAATDGRVAEADLQDAIVDTAVHPANGTAADDRYGHGVVDAPAAVGAAVEATPPESEPTAENDADTDSGAGAGTDEVSPGFGAAAALVAVTVAALLGVRRSERS